MPINWSNPLVAQMQLSNTLTFLQPVLINYFLRQKYGNLLPQLATVFSPGSLILQRDASGEFFHIQGRDYFLRLQIWDGHRESWRGGTDVDWRIGNKAFHTTSKITRKRLDSLFDAVSPEIPIQDQVMGADQIIQSMAAAWDRDPLDFLYRVMRENTELCYDGEPLFSENHLHIDGRSFSNVVIAGETVAHSDGLVFLTRAAETDPTVVELHDELELISSHIAFIRTRLLDLQWITTLRDFLIICNDNKTARAFESLSRRKYLSPEGTIVSEMFDNPYYQKLTIVRDHAAATGTETRYKVIPMIEQSELEDTQTFDAVLGLEPIRMLPRPLSFVNTLTPDGVQFNNDIFHNREVEFGMDGEMAMGVGLPSEVVERREPLP